MDNMKSMGFDHTKDTNRESFNARLDILEKQGLSWRIAEQFDLLTNIKVLDPKTGDKEGASTSRRDFYDRFFTFWRKATKLKPRWDVHFWGLEDNRKDSTAPHNHP